MALSELQDASVVDAAYHEVLANLLLALVESGTLPSTMAAECVRRGKAVLASYPLEGGTLIEHAHSGMERLAQRLKEAAPRD